MLHSIDDLQTVPAVMNATAEQHMSVISYLVSAGGFRKGNVSAKVMILFRAGLDVNAVNDDGDTPIMMTAVNSCRYLQLTAPTKPQALDVTLQYGALHRNTPSPLRCQGASSSLNFTVNPHSHPSHPVRYP
jgi:ankyrin repeat protein